MGEGTQHIRSRNRGVIYFCSTAWNYVSSCRDEVVKDLGGLAEKEGGRKEYFFLCTETLLCTRTVNDWCGSSVQGEQYICPLGSSQQQTCSWLCCSSYSHARRGGHLHIQRPNCNWVIVGAVWGFSGLGTGFWVGANWNPLKIPLTAVTISLLSYLAAWIPMVNT